MESSIYSLIYSYFYPFLPQVTWSKVFVSCNFVIFRFKIFLIVIVTEKPSLESVNKVCIVLYGFTTLYTFHPKKPVPGDPVELHNW